MTQLRHEFLSAVRRAHYDRSNIFPGVKYFYRSMTDTSIGFSNPAYNELHNGASNQQRQQQQNGGGAEAGLGSGAAQLSRSNSIGEDPDHIEVGRNIVAGTLEC